MFNISHITAAGTVKTAVFALSASSVKRFYGVIIFILALSFNAMGQFTIKVIDADEKPLEDVRVDIVPIDMADPYKNAKAILTDEKGEVTITLTGRGYIKAYLFGYKTVEDTVALTAGSKFVVTLQGLTHIETETVVTGVYEPTSVDKSVPKIKIIDAKRIMAQGSVTLKDVLSNELNIRLRQDNILGSSLSMQGISGQNIKILIDGVPVIGRLDGNIDLSQINLSNIERIEIIEGPMSVMYGTDALGGVINLITKKNGQHSLEGNANTYYENVGNYNIDGRLAYKTTKGNQFQFSGGRNFFDGFGENGLRGRMQRWKPKEQYFADGLASIKVKNSTHRLQLGYFNELLLNRGEPVIKPYSAYAFDNYFYTTRLNNSLFSDFKLKNNAHIQFTNAYSYFRRENILKRRDLVSLEDIVAEGTGSSDTSVFDLFLFRGIYTSGRKGKLNYQAGYDINLETGTGRRIENNKQTIGDYAAYATVEYKPAARLVIRPGIRASYNTRYGSPVTPSLNIKYDVTSKFSLRGSYARGFRAPSLKELNLFFVDVNHNIRPNNNLQAEVSDNFTLSGLYSAEIKKALVRIEPSLFYNDLRNMIGLAMIDAQQQLYSYVNIGEFNSMGANLNAQLKYNRFSIQAGVSYTGFKNYVTGPGVPGYSTSMEHRLNVSYSLPKSNTDINLFYKRNGEMPGYTLDANNQVSQTYIQAYSMADASVSQPFYKRRVTLIAGCRNLFNVGQINYNAPAGAHSGSTNTMSIGMGRSFFVNIRIHLFKQGR